MSDCTEICPDLGACCRIFSCNAAAGKDHARRTIAAYNIPFIEIRETPSSLITRCRCLQPDGKCSEYETRPDTCREFLPYTDALCCLFVGPPERYAISVNYPELIARYRHSNVPPKEKEQL